MKRCAIYRLTFLFGLLSFLVQAQDIERVNSKIEKKWKGTIVFNDERELKCNFVYNPLTPEGLLFVKQDSLVQVLGVTQVKEFYFFDERVGHQRHFYAIPVYNIYSKEPSGKYFFEEIHPNKEISIVGRVTVRISASRDQYATVTKVKLFDHYSKYLLDHKSHVLHPLSKKDILTITVDKKNEIRDFIKQNHLSLRSKNVDEYISLVNFYSSLTNQPRN